MARCKECIHYAVCAKEGRMVQVDEHTWDDYNQLDNVERFCENYISTADVAPRAEWISVEDRLPEEGEYVIVWVGSVQVARIEKGITDEERQKMKNGEVEDRIEYGWSQSTGFMPLKRSNLYKACDVHGNNRVPYCWKAIGGPMEWFGQNVTHWMPRPRPPRGE